MYSYLILNNFAIFSSNRLTAGMGVVAKAGPGVTAFSQQFLPCLFIASYCFAHVMQA
jgi:hypothetical protein